MDARPCIFCQIMKRETPSRIVYEDDVAIAFLDVAPRSRGMCIVAAKQHYKEFSENFDLSSRVLNSALVVAEMVKQALQPKAVSIALMPSATPHFHVRIYPFYEKQIPLVENKPLQMKERELDEIAEKIKAIKVEIKRPEEGRKEEVEEKPKEEEKPRSREEVDWIKRRMEVG